MSSNDREDPGLKRQLDIMTGENEIKKFEYNALNTPSRFLKEVADSNGDDIWEKYKQPDDLKKKAEEWAINELSKMPEMVTSESWADTMFKGATSFNQPISGSGWDISKVSNMSNMFSKIEIEDGK